MLRLSFLAVLHGVLLYGLFEHHPHPTALAVASYLRDWPLAEIIALIVTPYLAVLTVRNHERSLWERALWLPAALLVLGGIGGSVRILQATWFYVLTCAPVIWFEHTRAQADRGCAAALLRIIALIALAVVFEDRAYHWPIGTLAGKWMTPNVRYLANGMAFATLYFAASAAVEMFVRRVDFSK